MAAAAAAAAATCPPTRTATRAQQCRAAQPQPPTVARHGPSASTNAALPLRPCRGHPRRRQEAGSGFASSTTRQTAPAGAARHRTAAAAASKFDDSSPPRRPVVILPGLGNNSGDYDSLVQHLESLGLPCRVAQVSRPDWLRNAAGLLDSSYWKGTLKPRPVLDWYLERVDKAIAEAKAAAAAQGGNAEQVSVVAHSAGGWLARLFMAEFGHDDVSLLLTLGSPHLPPPRGVPGVVDQTRGLLYHIEETCPGVHHHPHVKYVCVSGRYIKGLRLFGSEEEEEEEAEEAFEFVKSTSNIPIQATATAAASAAAGAATAAAGIVRAAAVSTLEAGNLSGFSSDSDSYEERPRLQVPPPSKLQARIIGQGYKQVCGRADVWGDGVVPEASALLEGATHIILPGVYHSPVGASDSRPWYGSLHVLPYWQHHLFDSE